MLTLHGIRRFGLALVAGAMTGAAILVLASAPAGAAVPSDLCIPILPQTCTTTTTKPAPPPTTRATTAITAPKAATTTTTTAARRTTTTKKAPPAAQVGSPGLPAPVSGPNDLSALGPGLAPAAPQLAGSAAPTPVTSGDPVLANPALLPGLVGAARGLPDDHAGARIALSVVALIVAVVAAAQFPASRRAPRPTGDQLD